MITAKSPRGKLDILQASANNFYSPGLSLTDIQGFHEQYPLEFTPGQKAGRQAGGRGLSRRHAGWQECRRVCTRTICGRPTTLSSRPAHMPVPEQAKAIAALIRFYQTGDPHDWVQFGIDWVQDQPGGRFR